MNALIESIFLYNCEVWTLTKQLEEKIDIVQRQFLRRILNIKWYEHITNEEVYNIANCKKWADKVKACRIRWFGHLCRLPEDAPAKRALYEILRPCNKPQGRPKTTWLQTICDQLKELGINSIEEGIEVARNRNTFRVLLMST